MFTTILFPPGYEDRDNIEPIAPSSLYDLHLDSLLEKIVPGKKSEELRAIFYTPINELSVLKYRQELMEDLLCPQLLADLRGFSLTIDKFSNQLGEIGDVEFSYYRHLRFLELVLEYVSLLSKSSVALASRTIESLALKGFYKSLCDYQQGEQFSLLARQAEALAQQLHRVHYSMVMKDERIVVESYKAYQPLEQRVQEIFAPFFASEEGDYHLAHPPKLTASHVEVEILRCLAQIEPQIFEDLQTFYHGMKNFLPEWLVRFAKESILFFEMQALCNQLAERGLPTVLPQFSSDRSENVTSCYDIVLSLGNAGKVVTNDYQRASGEHIIVVSGPNQGGKTTFARSVGQLHHLAQLGLPVPAESALLQPITRIYTHFEREEHSHNQCGKLKDELVRLKQTEGHAGENSLILLNEVFSSTMSSDALVLSRIFMDLFLERRSFVLWVTFLDELASYTPAVVSMGSVIVSNDPLARSYKIVRKPADSLLYAQLLAEKYGLGYQQIKDRL